LLHQERKKAENRSHYKPKNLTKNEKVKAPLEGKKTAKKMKKKKKKGKDAQSKKMRMTLIKTKLVEQKLYTHSVLCLLLKF
jgi:hypothetical protein